MSMLKLDPLGQCLLRRLAEAEESRVASREVIGSARNDTLSYAFFMEYNQRYDIAFTLFEEFLEHLTLIGSPDVDISEYIDIQRQEMSIHEEDRDNGRVMNAAQDVIYRYLELWGAHSD